MPEESNSIFRPKMIEAVQSPEVLDNYLHVTSPGVWVFLVAVIFLLAGVLMWGTFGSIRTTVDVAVVSDSDSAYCVVPYKDYEDVAAAGTVTIGEIPYSLDADFTSQSIVDSSTDPRICMESDLKSGDYVALIPLTQKPTQTGVLSGTVVTETIKPISLLLQ